MTAGAVDPSGNLWVTNNWKIGANPFQNPGVSMEANKYVTDSTALPAVNNYRQTLINAGNWGISNANTPNVNAANATNSATNAVSGGLGALSTPTTDISQLLSQLSGAGKALGLNFGASPT